MYQFNVSWELRPTHHWGSVVHQWMDSKWHVALGEGFRFPSWEILHLRVVKPTSWPRYTNFRTKQEMSRILWRIFHLRWKTPGKTLKNLHVTLKMLIFSGVVMLTPFCYSKNLLHKQNLFEEVKSMIGEFGSFMGHNLKIKISSWKLKEILTSCVQTT